MGVLGGRRKIDGVGVSSGPSSPAEDVHDLKKQVRSLEEKNAVYMQQNLDLEEELRRSSSVKVQLNTHKQRVRILYLHRGRTHTHTTHTHNTHAPHVHIRTCSYKESILKYAMSLLPPPPCIGGLRYKSYSGASWSRRHSNRCLPMKQT